MSELAVQEQQHAVPEPAPARSGSESIVGEREVEPSRPLAGLSRPVDGADPMGGAAAPASVSAVLRAGGSPLPAGVRRTMEQSLGTDFSAVRLHTGGAAERSAADVSARAYSSGNNIVLGNGTDLASESGMHTLAHELTHVVQQRQGRDRGTSGTVGKANDPLEHEAESTAHDVMGALRRQTKNCGCGQEH
ncbi:DUF4157 domain-containing protein [Nocardioides sp. BP30]|uniref:eCIS core domain-containing protein n=1 Tax=Nocardioides sp. BP30 TaxID=3036374 RepID=UPI002468943E|nr:DUF4157 domain-containing protein [Nocardioides sp. BP30]WGL53217.1 DUF4157 domain-containing protein [Nocardioides sp. BP30]